MQNIINGGIYRVFFSGKQESEFQGEHPAMIIRTLKEEEIYMVIPLTTYNKEKMQKVKRQGYGVHIKSTNSIGRIDKYQVIHKRDIKNRWKDTEGFLRVNPEELKNLNAEVAKYITLSCDKAQKEYQKYFEQYQKLINYLEHIEKNETVEDNIFTVEENNNIKIIKCAKSEFYWLSKVDIYEAIDRVVTSKNYKAEINQEFLQIIIQNGENN